MFTDSQMAAGVSCGRTKTTQIMKRSIATELNDPVISKCRSQPFTIIV